MYIPLENDYDVARIKVGRDNHGEFRFPEGNGTVPTGIEVLFKQSIELSDREHTETIKSPCEGMLFLVSNKRRGQSLEVK